MLHAAATAGLAADAWTVTFHAHTWGRSSSIKKLYIAQLKQYSSYTEQN